MNAPFLCPTVEKFTNKLHRSSALNEWRFASILQSTYITILQTFSVETDPQFSNLLGNKQPSSTQQNLKKRHLQTPKEK